MEKSVNEVSNEIIWGIPNSGYSMIIEKMANEFSKLRYRCEQGNALTFNLDLDYSIHSSRMNPIIWLSASCYHGDLQIFLRHRTHSTGRDNEDH